ncbi:MAG: hypothetical protein JJ971_15885 [Balneolaceae bacterium]|nr:hypothetical protein [Balneolaceae bacterium]MBO6547881.1 hypothetical protein [Balneolaceae bacterium]MBO6648394.1 hypothetical protein [Balneolaceae bacterium]
MSADFSEMENAENNKAKTVAAGSNFNTALVASGIAKIILEANLTIPKVLLNAAQQNDPDEIASSEWEWSYSTTAQGNSYGVRLTAATNSNSDVNWKFYVTNSAVNPPLSNALFFEGNSDFNATSGSWIYYDLSTGDDVSMITWTKSENSASIDFEVTSGRNDNLGDTIKYNFDGTTKTLVYLDASSGEETTISFNTETKVGFIIAPNYNSGTKACWNENLENTACPN